MQWHAFTTRSILSVRPFGRTMLWTDGQTDRQTKLRCRANRTDWEPKTCWESRGDDSYYSMTTDIHCIALLMPVVSLVEMPLSAPSTAREYCAVIRSFGPSSDDYDASYSPVPTGDGKMPPPNWVLSVLRHMRDHQPKPTFTDLGSFLSNSPIDAEFPQISLCCCHRIAVLQRNI